MENNQTITGNIIHIGETETFGSGFEKRILVVEIGDQYPQPIPVEVVKDKCPLLDQFEVGENVTVHYDLRGRYWEKGDRYFVSVQAWKVESNKNAHEGVQDAAQGVAEPETGNESVDAVDTDEIPF